MPGWVPPIWVKNCLVKKGRDKDAEAAAADHAEALEEEREAAEELEAKIDDLVEAKTDLVGGDIAVRDAQRDAQAAAEDLGTELDGLETLTRDQEAALDDATEAQLRAAEQTADYEIAQREANGEVVSAAEKARLYKEKLTEMALTLDPNSALYAALMGYIGQLDSIQPRYETKVDADTWQARQGVQGVANDLAGVKSKTVTVTVDYRSTGFAAILGGISGGMKGFAEGGRPPLGEPVVVGETGAEIVTFDAQGAYVHTAGQSAPLLASPLADRQTASLPAHSTPSAGAAGVVTAGDVQVDVYVGTERITDIVDVRIRQSDAQKAMVA